MMELSSRRTLRSAGAFFSAALRSPKLCALAAPLTLLLLLVAPAAHAQNATYAGIERTVYSGASTLPGVAVDANGVVYIADQVNARVLKETFSGGSYGQTIVGPVSGGASIAPVAVAVDSLLNVYILDGSGQRVLKETWTGGAYTESIVDSGFSNAVALAVDLAQNIYVLDAGAETIVQEQFALGAYSPLALSNIAGLVAPVGIAVDSTTGNLFITDNFYGWVVKASYAGSPGSYTLADFPMAGGAVAGIATDATGNLYVTGQNGTGYSPLFFERWNGLSFAESEVATTLLSSANAVAVGANGHIYIADTSNLRVLEEIPSASAYLGTVAVGTPSSSATMLFAFNGSQSGIAPAVLTQGTPGLDFADTLSGSCTSNGSTFAYDGTDSSDGRYLFCSINLAFTPAYPGGRFGAASLIQAGAVIATGFAHGNGSGPQLVFTNPPQTQIALSLLTEQAVAADSAGNLYIVDQANDLVSVVAANGAVSPLATQAVINPSAIAADGAGNIYIADATNNLIYKETLVAGTPSAGSYTESAISTSALSSPGGIAVDGAGNLYIADTGNARALKETLTASGYTEFVLNQSTLTNPRAIAVDGSGNVYIGNTGGSSVLQETPSVGAYNETTIILSVAAPSAIAVDAAGNLFLTDASTGNILMESLSGGAYSESVLANSPIQLPTGIAVDGAGDIFFLNQSVNQLTPSAPTVLNPFASIQVGQTSSAQTFGIQNIGNAPLSFTIPGSGSNPLLDADFSDTASGNTTCPIVTSSPATLAAGASCLYSLEFTPTAIGILSTPLIIGDNSLNVVNATQTVSLIGAGLPETDLIAFSVPNQTFGAAPFAVLATSPSSGAFTYAVVSGPATLSGSTLSLTGAGSVTLSATQAASGNFASATQNASFTIAPETPVLVFSAIALPTTDSLPFLISASSASTGAVTYAVVSGPATIAGATVTVTGTGTVILSASQVAAGSYTAASATTSFPVTSGFTVAAGTPSSATATTPPGGAAAFSLSLTPGTGSTFPDALTLTVSGLPAGATATFSPASIAAGSPATTITLTVQTSSQTASRDVKLPFKPLAGILLALLLPLLGTRRARSRLLRCLPLILIALVASSMALAGCGTSAPTYPPAQAYTLVVAVTDAATGARTTTNLTLTVQ